jgi:hypothetical protein
MTEQLITVTELIKRRTFGDLTRTTIDTWIRLGLLRGFKFGHTYVVTAADLAAFVESNRQPKRGRPAKPSTS